MPHCAAEFKISFTLPNQNLSFLSGLWLLYNGFNRFVQAFLGYDKIYAWSE